jgi:hypothetical protein
MLKSALTIAWMTGLALCALTLPTGCSWFGCAEPVQSRQQAYRALAAFFSSESSRSQRVISELRADGMTDVYLERLRNGCFGCYVYLGHARQNEDPQRWYVSVSIAPREAKRQVTLEIECESSVSINEKLYGG